MKNPRFVICIRNEGYEVSLERRKLYEVVEDVDAARHGQIRVIDESGEDYLFSSDLFVPIELPKQAEKSVLDAA